MAMVCPRCSRHNPAEANFCYFDGSALAGGRGPLRAGSAAFPRPFVLPGGQACGSFDQLVLACQRHWALARDLLRQGQLEPFLASIGRLDLAQAARLAAQAPDPDRALDDLLGKFPNEVLEPAKLRAEPTTVNLGQVTPGKDGRFDLVLANQGMRLLFGAVACDCDWLALGDGPAQSQKVFQTAGEIAIPIRVLGRKLRAGAKPYEGRLCIDSNGGTTIVTVRAEAPIRPFPAGVLAGAMSPRDIAVKAKAHAQEAALLFEQGAVEQWYKVNGWDYPVQGPAGSGLGAVQQFFEALGLVKPPRVAISDTALTLTGAAGQRLQHRLQVRTEEKRPVFAHGWSDQPWLRVGPPQCQGPLVELPMETTVPPRPGERLEAHVTVRANGNQRFVVPVTLAIEGQPLPVLEAVAAIPVGPAPPPLPSGSPAPPPALVATFGMARLVYWGGLIGGWSAFAGWLVAELLIGWWVGTHFLLAVLMVVLVAGALGAGVSQVEGLITSQWRELRGRLLPGLLGGLAGGLLGGLLGNLLYLLLGQSFVVLGILGRILGWTLIGLAIGSADGLLRRQWRQVRNGLIGGGVGGFLGGLLFDPIFYVIRSPVSSRAFAFVLLGLFIGLSLGLVQVLLKEAWLTVEEGFRPGRQLILNDNVTTLGTSEKAGLIFIAYGARGVEPIHLRIRRREGGTYVLEDNGSRSGTLLNGRPVAGPTELQGGDLIQLGVNKVRFDQSYTRRGAD